MLATLLGSTMLSSLLPGLMDIIKRVIPDPVAQAQVQEEATKAILASQSAVFDGMKEVMMADANSTSAYTSGARPTVVYWSLAMITLLMFLGIFHLAGPALEALTNVPGKLWDLITFGIGAFTIGRSVEKTGAPIVQAVTTALVNRKK